MGQKPNSSSGPERSGGLRRPTARRSRLPRKVVYLATQRPSEKTVNEWPAAVGLRVHRLPHRHFPRSRRYWRPVRRTYSIPCGLRTDPGLDGVPRVEGSPTRYRAVRTAHSGNAVKDFISRIYGRFATTGIRSRKDEYRHLALDDLFQFFNFAHKLPIKSFTALPPRAGIPGAD